MFTLLTGVRPLVSAQETRQPQQAQPAAPAPITQSTSSYPLRTWTISRRPVEARLSTFGPIAANLENAAGQIKMVHRSTLGPDDHAYLRAVERTRKTASAIGGDDLEAATQALGQLALLGPEGAAEAKRALTDWFSAEFVPLRRALPQPTGTKPSRATVTAYTQLQSQIVSAIPNVSKTQVQQLDHLHQKMTAEMSGLAALQAPLARLAAYRNLLREHAPDLLTRAEPVITAVEADLEKAIEAYIPKTPGGSPRTEIPLDPAARFVWLQAKQNAIAAANASAKMTAEEAACVARINEYRVLLGRLPLRVDAALLQASRDHSQAMLESNFFSHTSPLPGLASFVDRAKAAGYNAASAENIAVGTTTGEATFWMWFHSPGHHKNLVAEGHRAVAVGQYNRHWTNMFGRK